jgi:hypothetical protein
MPRSTTERKIGDTSTITYAFMNLTLRWRLRDFVPIRKIDCGKGILSPFMVVSRIGEISTRDCGNSTSKTKTGTRNTEKCAGIISLCMKFPKGSAYFIRSEGENSWSGSVWVPEMTVAMMLTLLNGNGPAFVELHERRVGRNRWINGLAVQTADPAYE